MDKQYVAPQVAIANFQACDVLTSSIERAGENYVGWDNGWFTENRGGQNE